MNIVSLEYPETREPAYQQLNRGLINLLNSRRHIISEGTGSIADWIATPTMKLVVDRLDPTILLVADTYRGGALASVAGVLELLPQELRRRVRGVLFNRLDGPAAVKISAGWTHHLAERYGLTNVARLSTVEGISRLSENRWPVAEEHQLDIDLDWLVKSMESEIANKFFDEYLGRPTIDSSMRGVR